MLEMSPVRICCALESDVTDEVFNVGTGVQTSLKQHFVDLDTETSQLVVEAGLS